MGHVDMVRARTVPSVLVACRWLLVGGCWAAGWVRGCLLAAAGPAGRRPAGWLAGTTMLVNLHIRVTRMDGLVPASGLIGRDTA